VNYIIHDDFLRSIITTFNQFVVILLTPHRSNLPVPFTPLLPLRATQGMNLQSVSYYHSYSSHEYATDYRLQKTQNPIFKYDFKVGHYMTDSVKTLNRHAFITFNDVTGGIRTSP
jgi:hypothetical protein